MKIFYYPGPLWIPYAMLGNLGLALSVVLWSLACWLGKLFRFSDKNMTKLIRSWNAFLLRIYGLKVSVSGSEDRVGDASILVVSNHQSLFDIPVIYHTIGGNLRMVAKAELFKIPFFGLALSSAGFIPVQRDENSNRRTASNAIFENIKKGIRIWVAPESTRNPTPVLREFKSGSLGIAIQAGVPILPVVIVNAREVLPKGSLLPKVGSTILVHVLEPIVTAGMTSDQRHLIAKDLKLRMQEVLDNYYNKKLS